jgi:hypothetical protein
MNEGKYRCSFFCSYQKHSKAGVVKRLPGKRAISSVIVQQSLFIIQLRAKPHSSVIGVT